MKQTVPEGVLGRRAMASSLKAVTHPESTVKSKNAVKCSHHLKWVKSKKIALWSLLTTGSVLICSIGCTEQSKLKPSAAVPQRLLAVDGATLDRIPLDRSNVVYLQTIDLHKMQIDQLVGNVEHKGIKGLYYPSKNDDSSPFFQRLTVAAVRTRYQKQHPSGIFCIINASFFEDYKSSTRLSFPIKVNGTVITAGSSPYGPIQKPTDPYYQKIQLKALTWGSETATISSYNPVSGYPLNQASIKNGLVSYAYQDHPAYALAGDPVNRYHVLGILNSDADGKANRLLMVTANRATLKYAAEILRQQGVKGNIMTVDGGISTYLWNIKSGDVILPQVAEGEKVPLLPHYLGIRSKNK
jgi:hypothetical protein